MFNLPNLSSKALLLSGASLAALLLTAPAQATTLGGMTGRNAAQINMTTPPPRPAGFGGATTPDQAKQNTAQSSADFSSALARIQAQMSAQATARGVAIAGPNNLGADPNHPGQQLPDVPNGLGTGGLAPSANVKIDPSLWQNADAPTQSTSGANTTVTVQQTAQKAILTWDSFNVGKNTTVHFDQTKGTAADGSNNWIALNRIVDPSDRPSQILGNITAEGSVYLINNNGIIFGGSSQINVHSLIASSLAFLGGPQNLSALTPGYAAYDSAVAASDTAFLNQGVIGYGQGSGPVLGNSQPGQAAADIDKIGAITVEAGAQIQVGNLGYAILAAPSVNNGGTILAPDAQAILAAGIGVSVSAPQGVASSSWLSAFMVGSEGVGAIDATPLFTATNTGLIQATTGNVTLLGGAVSQQGAIEVTTSITRPGAITLMALDENVSFNVGQGRGGPLSFAPGSVTAILPEEDGVTTTSTEAADNVFVPGNATFQGGSITFQNNSLIEAPGAEITVAAFLSRQSASDPTVAGRIYVDNGATIDVAGLTGVELPITDTLLTISPLTANDLADAPLDRSLAGATVTIDSTVSGTRSDGEVWVGSPILDAQGHVDSMPRTIDQMLVKGGTINLAGSEVITAPGSTLNLMGGYIHYLGGVVSTTRFVDATGRLVDISQADPGIPIVGVAGQSAVDHDRWGITDTYTNTFLTGGRYESDYIQGGDAGALHIFAISTIQPWFADGAAGVDILDGAISASAQAGRHQVAGGNLPEGGALFIGDTSLGSLIGATQSGTLIGTTSGLILNGRGVLLSDLDPDFNANTSLKTPEALAASVTDPDNILYTSVLSAPLLEAAGFSSMNFTSATGIDVEAPLSVQPGGSISLTGGSVLINADVTAPSGSISMVGTGHVIFHSENGFTGTNEGIAGDITIASGVLVSAAGRWINDSGARPDQEIGANYIDGGSISLTTRASVYQPDVSGADSTSVDMTGSINLEAGSVLDVSSGGYVDPDGHFKTSNGTLSGKGGDISLQTYAFSGASVFGEGGGPLMPAIPPAGGEIVLNGTLRGYGFSGGGTLSISDLGIQIGGDPASAPSYALYLPGDFFSQGGFGAYNLTAQYDATIATGTTVKVTEQNFVPNITALMQAPTGANLYGDGVSIPDSELVSVGSLDLYHRQAADFSLAAGGYLDWNGSGNQALYQAPSFPGVTGTLLLDEGASILADPGANVSLTSHNQLTDLGTIVAHGGAISLTGSPEQGSSTTGSVWLGHDSVLDASGVVLFNSLAMPVLTASGVAVPRTGTVIAGGSVSVLDGTGTVVAEAGSRIDVSGTAATFDVAQSVGGISPPIAMPASVWSDAGSITLGGVTGLLFDGTLIGHGGAAQADGGTLILSSAQMQDAGVSNRATSIILQQSGDIVPAGLQPGQPIPRSSTTERFAIDRLNGSGIDGLIVGADPVALVEQAIANPSALPVNSPLAIGFAGDVSINMGRLFIADGASYVALPAGTTGFPAIVAGQTSVGGTAVSISAPYVDFGGSGVSTVLSLADSTLSVTAGTLDVTGQIVLQNFGSASFVSSGDIRFYTPTTGAAIPVGELLTSGNLTFQGAQLYPATANTFIVDAIGPMVGGARLPTTITILPNGDSTTPLSAGGSLLLDATDIIQQGTIRAPDGTLVLGVSDPTGQAAAFNNLPLVTTNSVTLTAGSTTSVSLDGTTVPYGTTIDGVDWQYQIFNPIDGNIAFPDLTAPPAKSISISGSAVALDPGATVDLSGGGTIQAAEWVAGIGGSRNLLLRSNTSYASGATPTQVSLYPDNRPIYAVIPGYNGPVAPVDSEFAPSGASVGQRVYLSGTPGLPAGYYTLLPAQYATVPGAFRVVQQTGTVDALAANNRVQLDGSASVAGYFADGLTGAHDAQTTSFLVQSAKAWGQYSQYTITNADTYFANLANSNGTSVPRLPVDAGQLALSAIKSLTLGAVLDAAPGTGGRGAQVDVTSQDIQIVGGSETARAGYLQINADDLSALGAESLLIGGTRTQTASGDAITVSANSVIVSTDAAHPLTGPEVILVTKTDASDPNAANGLLVESGSVIAAKGDVSTPPVALTIGSDTVSGDGALLAVSNGGIFTITRNNLPVTAQGLLNVQGGVTLSGGKGLTLDASGSTLVDPSALLSGTAIAADSNLITFVSGDTAPAGAGLVIGAGTLAQFAKADEVLLRSYGDIDFEGDVTVNVANNLTLSAGAFTSGALGTSGNVTINAGTLTLTNDLNASPPATPVSGSGTLALNGNEIDFGVSGSAVSSTTGFSGFGTVTATAVNGIVGQGNGTFDFGALPVTLTAPVIVAGEGGDVTFKTTGALTLNGAAAAGATSADSAFGGAITLIGGSVQDNALIHALAGNAILEATSGNLDVNTGAVIGVTGIIKQFSDTAAAAPGGTISLTADAGMIHVAQDATLNFAGAAGAGDAGSVVFSAPQGTVDLLGTLQGHATAGYKGGSFTLDTGGAANLDALAATLSSSGVDKLISVHTRSGNLDLSTGNTLKATNIVLTADGGSAPSSTDGNIMIDGVLDVSGPYAGEIALYGKSGVDIEGSLLANSTVFAQQGGVVSVATSGVTDGGYNTAYGYERVQETGSGVIHVGSGAVIDVSGGSSDQFAGGSISFRAPLLADGNVQINIDNGATLRGARVVTIEPYAIWSTADTTTGAQHFDGIIDPAGWYHYDPATGKPAMVSGTWTDATGMVLATPTDANTLQTYLANDYFTPDTGSVNTDHQSFYGYMNGDEAQGVGTLMGFVESPVFTFGNRYAGIANVQVRPGIQLDNPAGASSPNGGNISVLTNWNLGAGADPTSLVYRYNGMAPILSVLAGNNLDIEASITDGFYQQNDGAQLADPVAPQAPTNDNGYAAALAKYTVSQNFLTSRSLWNGSIRLKTGGSASLLADPNYQPLQAPLTGQSAAYYDNYESYIGEIGDGNLVSDPNSWSSLFSRVSAGGGFLNYSPISDVPGGGYEFGDAVPLISQFSTYAAYQAAYEGWLEWEFYSGFNTATPVPLMQPVDADYGQYSQNYAGVYIPGHATYDAYLATSGQVGSFGFGTQLFYAPFAPKENTAPTDNGYAAALAKYTVSQNFLTSRSLWNGSIRLKTGGSASLLADPNYQPLQAPLTGQSAAYYDNYESYIGEIGDGNLVSDPNSWSSLFSRVSAGGGFLNYSPVSDVPGGGYEFGDAVPLISQFSTYAAYQAAYEGWLEWEFYSGFNTATPVPLMQPVDADYGQYSQNYTGVYIPGHVTYDAYLATSGQVGSFGFGTQLFYAPFAPNQDAAAGGGAPPPVFVPVAPSAANNSPSNMPIAGSPVSLASATLLGGSSTSYRLVAGADLNSANPLAVNAASGGSITLGGHFAVADTASQDENGNPLDGTSQVVHGRTLLFPTTIRTGTGSIDVAAAGDIDWTDSAAPATIYTAGEPTPGTDAGTSVTVFRGAQGGAFEGELLVTGEVHPENAGDITIAAGGDIDAIEQVFDTDGTATGKKGTYMGQFWWPWMETGNPLNQSGASINFAAFDQGVMSAGGNATVTAGGDIRELSVSLPTNWYIEDGVLNTVGGGDLAVTAGHDILSGAYFVAKGIGALTAGGAIASDFDLSQGAAAITPVSTLLGFQDTNWTVTARQGADIGGAYDPSLIQNPLGFQAGTRDSQNPTSDSSLSILTVAGDARISTMTLPEVLFLGKETDGQVLPASLAMTALDGGIDIGNAGMLWPSQTGQLTLLADQSINLANTMVGASAQDRYFGLLDYDPSTLPSPLNPLPPNAVSALTLDDRDHSAITLSLGGDQVISHADDAEPVRIYSLNGDITDGAVNATSGGFYSNELILTPNKPAFIQAGHDIINLAFLGQNYSASDVTRIVAGHDIYDTPLGLKGNLATNYYVVPAMLLAGPGYFDVEAGRNIGPLTSANEAYLTYGAGLLNNSIDGQVTTGIQTIGDLHNTNLPNQSASISILFGIAPGMNDAEFAQAYFAPGASIPGVPNLSPELAAYIQQIEQDKLMRSGQGGTVAPLTEDEAWIAFQALPQYQQQAFIDKEFFAVLAQVGTDYNDPASPYFHQYARGYEAINTLFPASLGYTQNGLDGGTNGANKLVPTGTFDMRGATVQTQEGGDVNILGPGGRILVGSSSAPPFVVNTVGQTVVGPNQQGILTLEKGDVDIFSDDSLLLAQSRIFTEQGGDMVIWSSNGDINAGEGVKTSSDVPPPMYRITPDGFFTVDAKSEVTGAGIATLQTKPDAKRGNVFLIAPRGTVDAGAAGIRVSGDLFVAALAVANANNIQVQGKSVGLPPQPVTNLTLTTASTAATEAASITNSLKAQKPQSVVDVEVTGFGGAPESPALCVPSSLNSCR